MVILNDLVELQEPGTYVTGNNSHAPMHLQQHHFAGVGSPSLHHMGSIGRKVNNNGTTGRSSYRLSTFRPLHGQHTDLIRECIEDRLVTGPTYETIDPHHLSHLGYSTDYCTASGSGCSSGSSGRTAGCIETILPDPRCYGTTGRGHSGHSGRATDYIPVHPQQNNSIYNSTVRQIDNDDSFTFFTGVFTIISLISFVINTVVDTVLCYFLHYYESERWWFIATAAFTVIPAITVNAFSIKWHIQDTNNNKFNIPLHNSQNLGILGWTCKIFGHLLLIGPILRYFDLIRYGVKSRSAKQRNDKRQKDWHLSALPSSMSTLQRNTNHALQNQSRNESSDEIDYFLLMVHEDRDTSLLSLLRSLMESAPQLILQIYILAKRKESHNPLIEYVQIGSVLSSLFALSWSLASYHRTIRRTQSDKRNMTNVGTILQFLWRFFTIGSRVIAVALFSAEYGYWICPIAVGHWGIMTIWIMHQGTRFCDNEKGESRPCQEYLFNMVIGAIYLFCFLNVKDEPTRYKYLSYYIIAFMENASLILLWYMKSDPNKWYHTPGLAVVFGAFATGILFMFIYYWCFHPNGRPLWINRAARCC